MVQLAILNWPAVTDRLAGDFTDGAAPPGPNGIIIPLDDAT